MFGVMAVFFLMIFLFSLAQGTVFKIQRIDSTLLTETSRIEAPQRGSSLQAIYCAQSCPLNAESWGELMNVFV